MQFSSMTLSKVSHEFAPKISNCFTYLKVRVSGRTLIFSVKSMITTLAYLKIRRSGSHCIP